MLHTVKRWLGLGAPRTDWGPLPPWCEARGLRFRRERDDQGFVIEGRTGDSPWRLEWGPPQRDYLIHSELRLRAELRGPDALHMLVMSRPLADALERLAFERFTEATRTESDIAMPEEARWVSMYPAADLSAWRDLRPRLRVCSSDPAAVGLWLDEGLGKALVRALDQGPTREPPVLDPLVLMTLRGRLYLRTALARPDLGAIELALELADAAIRAALVVFERAGSDRSGSSDSGETAWQVDDGVEGTPPPR